MGRKYRSVSEIINSLKITGKTTFTSKEIEALSKSKKFEKLATDNSTRYLNIIDQINKSINKQSIKGKISEVASALTSSPKSIKAMGINLINSFISKTKSATEISGVRDLLMSYIKDIKNADVNQTDTTMLRNLKSKLESIKHEYRFLYSPSARSDRAKNIKEKYAKSGIVLNLRGSEVQVYDSIVWAIVNKHPDVIYLTDRMYSNNIQIEPIMSEVMKSVRADTKGLSIQQKIDYGQSVLNDIMKERFNIDL